MPHSPADVVGTLIERISAGRWTGLASHYAEDTVVEHPLQRSRLTGRQALADHFARAAAAGVRLEASDVVLHETTDPEVVVTAYIYRGAGFASANVQVVRVRDGLIRHSRDYHDPLRMAAARGDFTGIAEPAAPAPAGPRPEVPDGSPSALVLHALTGPPATRADLYAEDAQVTLPFHPAAPVLRGREALREHFATGARFEPRTVVFHQCADPNLIVTEVECAVGGTAAAANVLITRVRDGRIAESHDYLDHVAVAAATGTLPELFAAAQSPLSPARSWNSPSRAPATNASHSDGVKTRTVPSGSVAFRRAV
ncbi:ketosteroid isomerase-like protein [Amycolatopsis thermophila]|uniref:Ketosteroid isomerase-like protein n=1 Tax=Amycolatopsis thermophila TaxID=206084 RepID=A0ABU0ENG8_9PSEU|nr:ketosteroid isomerase-like protein [Amycolatopsis thermophila]